MNLDKFLLILKGGPGSGNHGHDGIPGHKGGSLPSGKILSNPDGVRRRITHQLLTSTTLINGVPFTVNKGEVYLEDRKIGMLDRELNFSSEGDGEEQRLFSNFSNTLKKGSLEGFVVQVPAPKEITTQPAPTKVKTDLDKTTDEFVNMYKGRYQKLSNAETDALKHYTWFSKRINSDLRGGSKLENIDAKTVKALDSAVKKFSFEKNVNMYWGIGAGVIDSLKRGEAVTNNGFTSASVRPETAGNFGEVVKLRFKNKPTFAVGDYTEQELIMRRGLKFRFNGYDEDGRMIVDVE